MHLEFVLIFSCGEQFVDYAGCNSQTLALQLIAEFLYSVTGGLAY